ncbi:MAG TPA: T9SS type A sorting domain-containing protein [Chitinophagales bacterium]|nr:T9SS type A sorting domain-containing protein [Chitinophagales bacterium]
MRNFFCCAALMCIYELSSSQTWTSIAALSDIGASWVNDLKVFENKLYIGGSFNIVNGDTSYWSCQWDGSSITPHPIFVDGGGLGHFDIFHDSLYASGGFNFGFDGQGVAVWNGITWQNASDLWGGEAAIYADSNDLYVGDVWGVVNKKSGNGSFAPLSAPFEGLDRVIYAIIKYNGSIVAAGDFISYDGDTLNSIARWDGNTWQPLGNGFSTCQNCASIVYCLQVFNGELYAGGYFQFADGSPAMDIAKWDGTSWSDVGGSVTSNLNGVVRNMEVAGNKLYAAGDFTQIGFVNASYLASWDGTTWHDEGFDAQGEHGLSCVEAYNGNLYVGTFSYFGDTVTNVYRRSIENSITILDDSIHLSVFPNPSSGALTLNLNSQIQCDYDLEVYNNMGVLTFHNHIQSNQPVNLTLLHQGIYTLLVRRKNEILEQEEFVVQY